MHAFNQRQIGVEVYVLHGSDVVCTKVRDRYLKCNDIVLWNSFNKLLCFVYMSYVIFYIYEGVFLGFVYVCLAFIFAFFYNLAVNASISMDIPSHNLDKWYKRSDNIIHAIFTLFT